MKDSLILEGKIYISAKRAAKIINYAQDYIGQLCRSGKLDCKMIGRSWYVTEESLLAHRESAVDATQERVQKVIKNVGIPSNLPVAPIDAPEKVGTEFSPVVVERKLEVKSEQVPSTLVTPVPAPIVSPVSSFKYEAEDKPALPPITKKLPQTFSLPKKVTDLTTTPFIAKNLSKSVEQKVLPGQEIRPLPRPETKPQSQVVAQPAAAPAPAPAPAPALVISPIQNVPEQMVIIRRTQAAAMALPETHKSPTLAIVIILILASGFMFSLSAINLRNASKPLPPLATLPKSPEINTAASNNPEFNGIGVVPSTGSKTDDALTKQRIKTSFSDEVTIAPDESGTAGVITPVFKKGEGDDFVYVLVPVKEQKQ